MALSIKQTHGAKESANRLKSKAKKLREFDFEFSFRVIFLLYNWFPVVPWKVLCCALTASSLFHFAKNCDSPNGQTQQLKKVLVEIEKEKKSKKFRKEVEWNISNIKDLVFIQEINTKV